ncbi:MAG: threonine ammonia-lyase, partial [Gammaproteobacteria bacterium]
SAEARASGVITHSSGNHGLCLSYAAGRRGIPVSVVVPRTAPEAKKQAMRGYGATVVECEPSTSSRESVFAEVVAKSGADFVHPYNDPRVIAGQATCSRELHDKVAELDAVVAPIGGGGMISGTCLTLSNISANTRIYAAEPQQADDAYESFKQGRIIADDAPETIADGLRASLGQLNFDLIRRYVDDIVRVEEASIVRAMKTVWERMKILIEPSAAVPVAALLDRQIDVDGLRVGVILSGGNVDLDGLPWMRPVR